MYCAALDFARHCMSRLVAFCCRHCSRLSLTDSNGMTATTPTLPSAKQQTYSTIFVSFCLALNIALSISIILLNKAVYTHVHFPNMTLTCVHFVFTTFGMVCCRCLGLFSFKVLPMRHMVPVSLTFCGFVVLTNLSLQFNTVGTYQIIKSMTTPVIIVIQSIFYARLFSLPVKLTVVRYRGGGIVNNNSVRYNKNILYEM